MYTSDQLCALSMRLAECLLLLLEQEVCLVWGQAAEVSPHWEVEPQLSGRVQTRLSKGQQFTVRTLLAVCKATHMGLKKTDFKHFLNHLNSAFIQQEQFKSHVLVYMKVQVL